MADRIREYLCGYAPYSDMRTLPMRNKIWNELIQEYGTRIVACCCGCTSPSTTLSDQLVSLTSLNPEFDEIVCVYHIFPRNIAVLHCMDVSSRLQARHVVTTTNVIESAHALKLISLSKLWAHHQLFTLREQLITANLPK